MIGRVLHLLGLTLEFMKNFEIRLIPNDEPTLLAATSNFRLELLFCESKMDEIS